MVPEIHTSGEEPRVPTMDDILDLDCRMTEANVPDFGRALVATSEALNRIGRELLPSAPNVPAKGAGGGDERVRRSCRAAPV